MSPKALKRLGQNFLKDPAVIEKIADAVGAGEKDFVVEVGPGTGVLTEALARSAGSLAAVEIDKRLIPLLKARLFGFENVNIINKDILRVDFSELMRDFGGGAERLIVAGNLPYCITTPLLSLLLEKEVPAESLVFMLQKEAADRISAKPGTRDSGVISLLLRRFFEIERICEVSRYSFDPVPKVDSTVLKFKRIRGYEGRKAYEECVKKAFSARRKTLGNSLAGIRGLGGKELLGLLEGLNIDPSRRAETLNEDEFARLSEALAEIHTEEQI